MKTQIRRNIFETNSSSTHALNVFCGQQSTYEIPEHIIVKPGEFGWECEIYRYPEDKLSYIYTWILSKCRSYVVNSATGNYEERYDYDKLEKYQLRIKNLLLDAGVKEVEFESGSGYWGDGYIDHSENLFNEDLETLLDKYFIDYVFNIQSYVETGNDNDDDDVSEDSYSDWSFYKGN